MSVSRCSSCVAQFSYHQMTAVIILIRIRGLRATTNDKGKLMQKHCSQGTKKERERESSVKKKNIKERKRFSRFSEREAVVG